MLPESLMCITKQIVWTGDSKVMHTVSVAKGLVSTFKCTNMQLNSHWWSGLEASTLLVPGQRRCTAAVWHGSWSMFVLWPWRTAGNLGLCTDTSKCSMARQVAGPATTASMPGTISASLLPRKPNMSGGSVADWELAMGRGDILHYSGIHHFVTDGKMQTFISMLKSLTANLLAYIACYLPTLGYKHTKKLWHFMKLWSSVEAMKFCFSVPCHSLSCFYLIPKFWKFAS